MREEMVGNSFGRWVVTGIPDRYGYVTCRCECGTVRDVQPDSLRRGTSMSCGCRPKDEGWKHGGCVGGKLRPEYRAWSNMLSRCRNPQHQAFSNYGGRGIRVCKRWESFTNFFADMGERPAGCSLERRKNWLGYSPANCYWATRIEQESNKRSNHHVTIFGETKTVSEWSRDSRCGVPYQTFKWRIREGWEGERALAAR